VAQLRLTDVTKEFDTGADTVQVLNRVSFELDAGATVAVTGPSGSGKSTLLHLIGTLDSPTGGKIEIDGRDPGGLKERQLARFRNATIGFIFQDHHLLPQYSVLENVLVPTLAFSGSGGDEARARELLDRVGLAHRLTHRPGQLSGGERQRVAVARALINGPGVLLCDEPTGSLDARAAASVTDLLLELQADQKVLLIIVTHSPALAGRCPRHFELKDGQCFEV